MSNSPAAGCAHQAALDGEQEKRLARCTERVGVLGAETDDDLLRELRDMRGDLAGQYLAAEPVDRGQRRVRHPVEPGLAIGIESRVDDRLGQPLPLDRGQRRGAGRLDHAGQVIRRSEHRAAHAEQADQPAFVVHRRVDTGDVDAVDTGGEREVDADRVAAVQADHAVGGCGRVERAMAGSEMVTDGEPVAAIGKRDRGDGNDGRRSGRCRPGRCRNSERPCRALRRPISFRVRMAEAAGGRSLPRTR